MIPRTIDALGFGDICVSIPGLGKTLVQVTSGAHHAAREAKIVEECYENARRWMEDGSRVEVWSWSKRGPKGRQRWTLRRTSLLVEGTDWVWAAVGGLELTEAERA
jgi:hypothetical protein